MSSTKIVINSCQVLKLRKANFKTIDSQNFHQFQLIDITDHPPFVGRSLLNHLRCIISNFETDWVSARNDIMGESRMGFMLRPKSATATFIKIQRLFWWSIALLSCLAWDYEAMREKTANGGRPLGPILNAHGGSLAVRLEFHSFRFMTLISCTREFFARINKQRTREKVREWYAERVRQG